MAGSSGYRADSPISTTIEVDDYDEYNDKDDPKRRISNITTTSVSSFPDSAWPSESDAPGPFYPTSKSRPTYRVGSLRRSPLPERLSPSSLRPPRHTSHRPRSRGEGDRPRSRGEDGRPRSREEDVVHYGPQPEIPAPLVLLHVTVLPPRLPWNRTVLDAILPPELKRQFGVLRAATSGLVAQRGILIAHPREEFELLEESVLEALDLLPERIGYDGQYRPRTPNTVTEGEANDEETEMSICNTCQRVHVGDAWYTRVYAANGLMRAGAWSACFSEMERVDCEVRPCISEHICRRLDEMQLAEDIANQRGSHDPATRSKHELQSAGRPKQQLQSQIMAPDQGQAAVVTDQQHNPNSQSKPSTVSRHATGPYNDLPPIYQAKDVPLSLLLRNYLYLVLRDRRNLAIFFLALTLLASTIYGMLAPREFVANEINLSTSQVQAVDEPSIPPVPMPMMDVGHGKRHPMWRKDDSEPQLDDDHAKLYLVGKTSDMEQDAETTPRGVPQDPSIRTTATATARVAVKSLLASTDDGVLPLQTSAFSSALAFPPLLQELGQCPQTTGKLELKYATMTKVSASSFSFSNSESVISERATFVYLPFLSFFGVE
ncbi:unnamed protein product [Aureobasidium uvarum]|uniref:Uncharacterized protein n=1 Tax=Aureobasidium uvarum TaxID=2773716 RepID=A0A9N8PNW0_9PEZI|nr:unnamed protein product [Aureobasidium uvarum]